MFDWFFKRAEKEESLLEIITSTTQQLQLYEFAKEKAIGMIADAIAKSEIVVQRKDKKGTRRAKDDVYWRLNVRPNANETGTDFWRAAIHKLLTKKEALICRVGEQYFLADSWTLNDSVILPQIYSNIMISCNGRTMTLDMYLTADQVLHLRMRNDRLSAHLGNIAKKYNKLANAVCTMQTYVNTPKFKLHFDATNSIIATKDENGNVKTLTKDQYKEKLQETLLSDEPSTIITSAGIDINQIEIKAGGASEDVVKFVKEIFKDTAMAFNIPMAVFLGEITEKADSTNEFITYAVSPIAEILNDSFNAKLVGKESYEKDEKIWVDLSRFKHRDLIECATGMSTLRSIGFNLDELRESIGWEALNTEFSRSRMVTKNYTADESAVTGNTE